jgi:hypothetical protein
MDAGGRRRAWILGTRDKYPLHRDRERHSGDPMSRRRKKTKKQQEEGAGDGPTGAEHRCPSLEMGTRSVVAWFSGIASVAKP